LPMKENRMRVTNVTRDLKKVMRVQEWFAELKGSCRFRITGL
jgi:hypothetical protein